MAKTKSGVKFWPFPSYFDSFYARKSPFQWQEHCQLQRSEGSFTLAEFEQELAEERARPEMTERTAAALNQLEVWVRSLCVSG